MRGFGHATIIIPRRFPRSPLGTPGTMSSLFCTWYKEKRRLADKESRCYASETNKAFYFTSFSSNQVKRVFVSSYTFVPFFAQTGPPVSSGIHTRGHIFLWKCKSWNELLRSVSLNENLKLEKSNFIRWELFPNITSQEKAFGLNDTLGELMNTNPFLI